MHYTEKDHATANLAAYLESQGWTLYGYAHEQSDPMTDYFPPRYWRGIATHPDHPGILVGCCVSQYLQQRRDSLCVPQARNPQHCDDCNNHGLHPGGWTLTHATSLLPIFNAQMGYAPDAPINPKHFDEEGRLYCHCKTDTPEQTPNTTNAGWPWFEHVTPTGKMWHVEKDGRFLAAGTGFSICSPYARQPHPGCVRTFREISAAIQRSTPKATDGSAIEPTTFHLEEILCTATEEPWATYLHFAAKPSQDLRTRLRNMGASWDRGRYAWRFPRSFSAKLLRETLSLTT